MNSAESKCGWGVAVGCFTDVLHSSKNYHQKHAIEPCRLPEDVAAASGAVSSQFHGVINLYNLWRTMAPVCPPRIRKGYVPRVLASVDPTTVIVLTQTSFSVQCDINLLAKLAVNPGLETEVEEVN
jgi:hypothetical protein